MLMCLEVAPELGEDTSLLSAAELAAAGIFHTNVDVLGSSSRTFALQLGFLSVSM
jgi:hypothetical protein